MRWTASKLARYCAHAHVLSELTPKSNRDKAAARGKAFHAAMEEWHNTGLLPLLADDDLATWLRIMVDNGWAWPDGCVLESAWGLSHWGTPVAVEEKPPGSHTYVALDGEDLMTAGRADIHWMHGDVLVVVDWKTGRFPAPLARVNLQVNAAGIALAQRWKARAYVPGLYYAREGRWDMGEEVEVGSPGWTVLLADVENAAALDDQPHPGDQCSSCWERKSCSATP